MSHKHTPLERLELVQRDLQLGEIRTSRKGVPHLVINNWVSIVYYGRKHTYRIFTGYRSPENKPHKDFKNRMLLVNYIQHNPQILTKQVYPDV